MVKNLNAAAKCRDIKIIWIIVLVIFHLVPAAAQIAMPDTVCLGGSKTYKVNDAVTNSTYIWKIDGIVQPSVKNEINIIWNTAGIFKLTVQELGVDGCMGDVMSGLVNVSAVPIADAGSDMSICFGNTARLNGSGGMKYYWSPSTYLSDPNISQPVVSLPGEGKYKYSLKVINALGCSSSSADTIALTMLKAVKVFAGNDLLVAKNQPVQLNAEDINNSGFISYLWTPSFGLDNEFVKNPKAVLNNDNIYIVTATTNNGCTAKDDILIKVFEAPEIYMPNSFTPNGDGLNDILKPTLVGIKELKFFMVYNRYGELLFKTSLPGQGWNGLFQGQLQSSESFVWVAEATDYRGNVIKRSGSCLLLR